MENLEQLFNDFRVNDELRDALIQLTKECKYCSWDDLRDLIVSLNISFGKDDEIKVAELKYWSFYAKRTAGDIFSHERIICGIYLQDKAKKLLEQSAATAAKQQD